MNKNCIRIAALLAVSLSGALAGVPASGGSAVPPSSASGGLHATIPVRIHQDLARAMEGAVVPVKAGKVPAVRMGVHSHRLSLPVLTASRRDFGDVSYRISPKRVPGAIVIGALGGTVAVSFFAYLGRNASEQPKYPLAPVLGGLLVGALVFWIYAIEPAD